MKTHLNYKFVFCIFICLFQNKVNALFESDPTRMIVGGEEAVHGRYPYQVEVFSSDSNGEILLCGGTLIDPEWVLSSAQCYRTTLSRVAIGRHNHNDNDGTYELINIEFTVIHPNFSPLLGDNDILMIKLSTPSKSPVIKLNSDPKLPEDSMNVTVMGWGTVDMESGANSDALRETELSIISNVECSNINAGLYLITNSILCAVTQSSNEGPCMEDAGGPIIIKGENATMDIQIGIMTRMTVCGDINATYISSRVSTGLDFINTILSCTVPDDHDLHSSKCCQVNCENGEFTCVRRGGYNVNKCNVDNPCGVGNGYCQDGPLNTAECNYDGGDCCADTCVDAIMPCGLCYVCRNPESPNYSPPILRQTINSILSFLN